MRNRKRFTRLWVSVISEGRVECDIAFSRRVLMKRSVAEWSGEREGDPKGRRRRKTEEALLSRVERSAKDELLPPFCLCQRRAPQKPLADGG